MLVGKKTIWAVLIALIWLVAPARAQSAGEAGADDPAKRAAERIRAAVDERARTAERVLAASELIRESEAARKLGRVRDAREALEKAELIASGNESFQRGALIDEVLRRVADERAALNIQPLSPDKSQGGWKLSDLAPRPVFLRYQAWRGALERVLVEEKAPTELLAVALIESGFNPLALSPKGARGIWQFMPSTAERYGLRVRPDDDHRTHPEHSTRAAARYLRDLYRMFGDWKLALAAYNAGETKVQQVIERTGVRDFDELSRLGLLPLETRKYVPAVLAVWSQLSGGRAVPR